MRKILLTTALITLTSSLSHAAGFYIQEQSVSGLGSAFAGQAAMPRDASILFYNPAGLTYLEGTHTNVGVHVLRPYGDIDDNGTVNSTPGGFGSEDGNPYSLEAVPNAYISHQINNKLWIGAGLSAPFGLGSEYDDDWFGRFDATETSLLTLDIQPSIAYKATDWLSLGGTLIVQYANAELKNRFFAVAGSEGEATLKGNDISFGFNAGAIIEPRPDTRIGLDYRSEINHELDGSLDIVGTGTAASRTVPGTVALDLPDIATLSLAHDVDEKWTVMGSASYFGWNSFNHIQVVDDSGAVVTTTRQNYDNTFAFSVGAEYDYSDDWTFRAGYQFDQTPTSEGFRTSRTPDGDRNWFAAGATYNINDALSVDMAGTYITVSDEDINLSRNPDGSSQVNATTDGNVGIVAVGLNYKF